MGDLRTVLRRHRPNPGLRLGRLPAQPVCRLRHLRDARPLDQPVLGFWGHPQSRPGHRLRARRLRHGHDHADAVAGSGLEPDPALHAQQQPGAPALVLAAVLEHRRRHPAGARRTDAVLRRVRDADVPRPGLGAVLRDHVAGNALRLRHADPRHAALHQRRQRPLAARAAEPLRHRYRSLRPDGLLDRLRPAHRRHARRQALDPEQVRPRGPGPARRP